MNKRSPLIKIRALLALLMVQASFGAQAWAQVEAIGGARSAVGGSAAAASAAGVLIANPSFAPVPSLTAGEPIGSASVAPSVSPAAALAAPNAAVSALAEKTGEAAPEAVSADAKLRGAQPENKKPKIGGEEASARSQVQALHENLAGDLKAVGDQSGSSENSQTAGRRIINQLAGGRDASVGGDVAPDAAAGLPSGRPQSILEKLGLRDEILRGGGIEIDADGRIKPVAEPIRMHAYDNDDNIAHYNTSIYIRHKTTHEEVGITTEKYAEVRNSVGRDGEYKDYEFFGEYGHGSFRDFRDVENPDIFPQAAVDAVDGTRAAMFRGPAWLAFAQDMRNPKTAPWTAVVTSRGHESENMVRHYDVYKDRGLLARSPRQELIFATANATVAKALRATSTPEQKTEVLLALIDLLESIPLANPGDRHIFSFSDDDLDMITRVKNKLTEEQAVGRRWPHVKLTLFSTGPGTESRTELVAGLEKPMPGTAASLRETAVPAPQIAAAALIPGAVEPIPQAGATYPGDAAVKARKITDTIFVVYDLETTGLHPEVDAPIQVGAAKFRVKSDGSIEVLGTFDELIDPKVPMPAEVTLFTNITNGDLQGKPTIDQVLPRLRAFAGEDAVLLGHNVGFDVGFLGYQMKKHGIAPMPQMVLDTKELVKNLFPDILDRRLAELIALWELGSVEEHNGLSDSLYTAKVFARVLQRVAELKNSRLDALTVGDAAEKSPNFHFDAILETLEGRPVEHPRPVTADAASEVEAKAQELFWKRQPSQLRDVAVALGMDYAQLRGALLEHAAKAAVSPADGILQEISANPPEALIFGYDALVDRNSGQESYPPVADDVVAGLIRLLKSGRPVGVVASYGLEDDAALRSRIPASLRSRFFFSRAGARPLYDAMRAAGVDAAPKDWLVVGTHLSVAEAFPEAKVLGVGDYVKDAPVPNARHLGIKGSRASLRIVGAIAAKNARARKASKLAPAQAPPSDASMKEPEGRRVSFLFNWEDIVRDHPGKSLAQAVARPKSVWQGPNWFDFVNALSNDELARNVHIVGRESASMASDLKTLHELGLIKHMPEPAHLRPRVSGSAENLEVIKGLLDGLQQAPHRTNSNKIYNQNGTAKKLLHLFAVSDGDWDHYLATRRALSAQIRKAPKRWSQVKIVLRYTGDDAAAKNGPVDAALTSAGGIRPLLISEFAEPFGNRFSETQAPGVREKTPPIATSIHSSDASVDAAIKTMYVSHSYGNADPLVVDGDDLVARERQAVADFAADKKIPNERKHIILTRYHVEDKLLAKILVDALKTGVRVDFITDFNSSMEYEFPKRSQTSLQDFSKAKLTEDALGEFLQILLDGGFKIVGNGSNAQPRGAIYSQPIFNQKSSRYSKMIPIMHEKSLLFVVEPKAGTPAAPEIVDYYFGTANLSEHKRYNRLFRLQEKPTEGAALEHAQKLMEGFRAGLTSIEAERPLRVVFEDESYIEMGNSNNQYNLNGRIVDLFERAAKGELQIENVIFSHFAPTKSNLFPALRKAMAAQTNFRVFSISDQKFTSVDSYGKVAVMGGFLVTPPLGGPGWGWSGDMTKRAKALEFLRGVDGLVETDPKGAPTEREVWHDKTTLVSVNEGGRRWTYVFTGSFNASNKADNAELQFMFRFPTESHWVKAIEDSIVKTVDRQKDYVLPLSIGLVRDSIAAVAGMSPLYVPVAAAHALIKAAQTRDASALEPQLQAMIEEASRVLGAAFQPRRAVLRFKTLLNFMAWFHSEREQGRMNYPLTVQKLVAIATVVGNLKGGMTTYSIKSQLNKALWDPTADKDEMERRVARAWDVLGIEAPMPSRAAKWGGAQKDPRQIQEPAAPFVSLIPAGNHLKFKNKTAFNNAVKGVSTVYLKGGIGKDHKVGSGQLELEGTNRVLPVSIDSIKELPFSKITVAIMKRLAPGMTKDEFFSSMQKRYPGFKRNSMVTVLRFHAI